MNRIIVYILTVLTLAEVIQLLIGVDILFFLCIFWVTYIIKKDYNLDPQDYFLIVLSSIFLGIIYLTNWGFLVVLIWITMLAKILLGKFSNLGSISNFIDIIVGVILFIFLYGLSFSVISIIFIFIANMIFGYLLLIIFDRNSHSKTSSGSYSL